MNSVTLDGDLSAGASIEVLGDAITGYIVNVVREKGEEAVRIPSSISVKLKAHQVFLLWFFATFCMNSSCLQNLFHKVCGYNGVSLDLFLKMVSLYRLTAALMLMLYRMYFLIF